MQTETDDGGSGPPRQSGRRTRVRSLGVTLAAHALLVSLGLLIVPSLPVYTAQQVLGPATEAKIAPPASTPDAQLIREDLQFTEMPEDLLPVHNARHLLAEVVEQHVPQEISADSRQFVLGLSGSDRPSRPQGGAFRGDHGAGKTADGLLHRRANGVGKGKYAEAVNRGLDWLCDHQNPAGYWGADSFHEDSHRKNARFSYNLEFWQPGAPAGDRGTGSHRKSMTGLALLAFTAYGYDHRTGPERYRNVCRNGLQYLLSAMEPNGSFTVDDESGTYTQSICVQALSELYGLSGEAKLVMPARRALYYLLDMQKPGNGWRYGYQSFESDTSVTGWAILAMKCAEASGILVDTSKAREGALHWLDSVTIDVNGYPRTGYISPGGGSGRGLRTGFEEKPSMDAINVMARYFLKDPHKNVHAQADEIAAAPPEWKQNEINFYYWYYGTIALHQVGGSQWTKWEKSLAPTLTENQRGQRPEDEGETDETLDEYGSWDPVGAYAQAAGRVYATALNCLTLSIHERYQRLQEAAPADDGG